MPSELLPPFGQWAFGESRVQKNIRVIRVIRVQKNIECDPCAKNIIVLSALFVFKRIYKGLCPKLSTNKIYFK